MESLCSHNRISKHSVPAQKTYFVNQYSLVSIHLNPQSYPVYSDWWSGLFCYLSFIKFFRSTESIYKPGKALTSVKQDSQGLLQL